MIRYAGVQWWGWLSGERWSSASELGQSLTDELGVALSHCSLSACVQSPAAEARSPPSRPKVPDGQVRPVQSGCELLIAIREPCHRLGARGAEDLEPRVAHVRYGIACRGILPIDNAHQPFIEPKGVTWPEVAVEKDARVAAGAAMSP